MADPVITVKLNGFDQLRYAMLRFPKELDQRLLQSAMLPAAQVVRDAARNLAPVLKVSTKYRLSGVLKRNIRMARTKPAPGMTATVIIGVRKFGKAQLRKINRILGASKTVTGKSREISATSIIGNPFYWRFMEFGYTDRGGTWHGPHGGKGYLRPAFEANKTGALTIIERETGKRVDIVAQRLGIRTSRGR